MEQGDLVVIAGLGFLLVLFSNALGRALGSQMEKESGSKEEVNEQKWSIFGFRLVGSAVMFYALWRAVDR